jgi:RAB protein geranylgeranyltransferase component A
MTETRGSQLEDKRYIEREFQPPIFPRVLLVTARMLKVLALRGLEKFLVWQVYHTTT